MDNIEQKKETEEKFIKIINDISVEEINNALKGYDLTGNIFQFSSTIPFFFGASILLASIGEAAWGGALTFIGLGKFGYEALMYEGIAFAPIGLGFICGGAFLVGSSYLFYKLQENRNKENDKKKNFIEGLKDPNSRETKIFYSFLKNLSEFLSKNLCELIQSEFNELKKFTKNLELDSQKTFNKLGRMLLAKAKQCVLNFHETDILSVLVLGKTGVGKTTLINAILNKESNEDNIGLPNEMDSPQIKITNRKLFPALDIWDSRGIELSKEFNIDEYSKQVMNFIKNGLEEKENKNIKKANNFIHCIWYCINGTRIEKSELEYIKKLKSIYSSDKKLPIIFVYTRSYNRKQSEKIKETIINVLKDENINYIDVVAKEIIIDVNDDKTITIPKKNLKKLMEESLNLSKNGFESVFYGNIFDEYKNLLDAILLIKPLNNSIKNIEEKLSSLYKEKKSYYYINEEFPRLLFDSLSHLYHDEEQYKKMKINNKKFFDEWELLMKNWYKISFQKFSKTVNKDLLLKMIDKSIDDYFAEIYNSRISKIPDFEFLSVFDKNLEKNKIESCINNSKEELKIKFYKLIDGYIRHKETLMSNFIIEYISKEFLNLIYQKFKEKSEILNNDIKKEIDLEVKEIAKQIYNNIINGINLDLIP